MNKIVPIVLVMMLAACATPPSGPAEQWITPEQAVMSAAAAAPQGVAGPFRLQVLNTGEQNNRVFLNSEADYRDQRSLTIAISPAAADALQQKYGQPPDEFFEGRDLLVNGEARRTRINFMRNGAPSGKYYYQTHVRVDHQDQIQLLN